MSGTNAVSPTTEGSEVERVVMCGCKGHPIRGAVCGLVAVGGKICKAPNDYECVYKEPEYDDPCSDCGAVLPVGHMKDHQCPD